MYECSVTVCVFEWTIDLVVFYLFFFQQARLTLPELITFLAPTFGTPVRFRHVLH